MDPRVALRCAALALGWRRRGWFAQYPALEGGGPPREFVIPGWRRAQRGGDPGIHVWVVEGEMCCRRAPV